MEIFILLHIIIGFFLIIFAVLAAYLPKKKRTPLQSIIVKTFFFILLTVIISGIAIGIYRHPTSVSVFQIVTMVGFTFAVIGLLAEMGKLEGIRGKSNFFWYINGLGGSLIATTSASLFFLALTYFPEFYKENIFWLGALFIAIPVVIGREFIKKSIKSNDMD